MKEVVISGNEAIAYGAIYAGCRFFAGYPITPSTDLAEKMSYLLPLNGGVFIQMEDELGSISAIIGASLAGKKAMTATSGPGFSLMQEGLGFASYSEIPIVVADIERVGPSTGIPTYPSQGDVMQTRWGTHGSHPVIVFYPSSVYESYKLTVEAFNYSEKYRTPVILLSDEVIGHMREKVRLVEDLPVIERLKPNVSKEEYLPFDSRYDVPPIANFGEGYRFHITGLTHDETGFPTSDPEKAETLIERLHRKIYKNMDDIGKFEAFYTEDAEYLIISYGATARGAKDAVIELRRKGIKVGLFRPITIWPSLELPLREIADGKKVFVFEMNLGQYVLEVERILKRDVVFFGKENGELITPEEMESCIQKSL
ncbi:2-oxoacid:acceptor oxidoreductase subunit alpha [Caldisericum exile]|uniref:2-oxoglutarate ferredoxin oxidoreductase alpha subunit n=1 Tax=Caldisericum exile (strain DSM 21853 / NBRC 104410 / AZM16c01) TaxID=511051 RepID=A0A7U6GEY0_CALEA|nr:2-oxoacid:acceptor oxidoreductase subunit alpha [Caldisericum exile]BAL81143.1 2-oxoglutarate ferredoxin oxidoreductase alpha subunit [Caldisericum exile AZM16c01]